jgi:lipocalin
MSRSSTKSWFVAFTVIAVFIALGSATWAFLLWLRKPLRPVPLVDLQRFAGPWFPIATSPRVDRRVAPGQILVTDQGLGLLEIEVPTRRAGAERQRCTVMTMDGGANWRLNGGPLGASLSVLALAPDYSACLLGSPDRTISLILSRSSSLDRTMWTYFMAELERQGFSAEGMRQVTGTRVALN